MDTKTIKPKIIALVAIAVTLAGGAATAATRLAGSGCCPLCK